MRRYSSGYNIEIANIRIICKSGIVNYNVAKTHQRLLPVEVKYQKAINFRDLKTIHKLGFKRGLLISRDRLKRLDEYWIVSLELFLLYLEEFLEAGNESAS